MISDAESSVLTLVTWFSALIRYLERDSQIQSLALLTPLLIDLHCDRLQNGNLSQHRRPCEYSDFTSGS